MSRSSNQTTTVSIDDVFGNTRIGWGNKYPKEKLLREIWEEDADYLLWSCNLKPGKPNARPPGPLIRTLVTIAQQISLGKATDGEKLLVEVNQWKALTQEGIGLEKLPRPSAAECLKTIENSTVFAGHGDLDGLYSVAIAIRQHAQAKRNKKISFGQLRVVNYGYRSLADYTVSLNFDKNDSLVIIDFSAHPDAQLNLDHHSTCLSYWEFQTEMPAGIFDTSMPSCPRLLATHCGIKVNEEVLVGCDMIDGAIYQNLAQAHDLSNPFVALGYALSVDVSDSIAKKVILTLAENDLDPYSVLGAPVWKARIEFLRHQIDEQRSFWSKPTRYSFDSRHVAIADARMSPYSASRFRFLPFENPEVLARPYLITVRGGKDPNQFLNLGIGRNPFYKDRAFYEKFPIDLGSLAASLGSGGGRREASSLGLVASDLRKILEKVTAAIEASVS